MLPTGLDTDGTLLINSILIDESAQIKGFFLFLGVPLQLIQIYPPRDFEQKDLAGWEFFLRLDCLQLKNASPCEVV